MYEFLEQSIMITGQRDRERLNQCQGRQLDRLKVIVAFISTPADVCLGRKLQQLRLHLKVVSLQLKQSRMNAPLMKCYYGHFCCRDWTE